MTCNIAICNAWCCKQFWIDLPNMTPDLEKYFKLHNVEVSGNTITIPLRCKNLDYHNKCKDYNNRPNICKIWNCKDPKNKGVK